jgi:hypothetical protein
MDRQGRQIKGGKVLDPDLFNEPETAYEIMKAMTSWKTTGPPKFATTNPFANLRGEGEIDDGSDKESDDDNDADISDEENDSKNSNHDNDQNNNDKEKDTNSDNEAEETKSDSEDEDEQPGQTTTATKKKMTTTATKVLKKPFKVKNSSGPMKTKTMKSRDVKNLQPSEGFLKAIQRNQ